MAPGAKTAATGTKKRRLDALEQRNAKKRQKKGAPPGKQKPASPGRPKRKRQKTDTEAMPGTASKAWVQHGPKTGNLGEYGQLHPSVLRGPVGRGLKMAGNQYTYSTQAIHRKVMSISDTSRSTKRTEDELSQAMNAKALVVLGSERRGFSLKTVKDERAALKLLSNTQRKKRGLDPLQADYSLQDLENLQETWSRNAAPLMSRVQGPGASSTLQSRLDLHGCKLSVAQCKNPRNLGIQGTMIKESAKFVHLAVPRTRRLKDQESGEQTETYVVKRAVERLGSVFKFEYASEDGAVRREITIPGPGIKHLR